MNQSILMPVVRVSLDKNNIQHKELECLPEYADTAAFCEHYNLTLSQAANTILITSRKVEPAKYALCVVAGDTRLDVNKKVCELLGVKRASFAGAETTKELTNMMIGGVTIFGVENLPIYVDSKVLKQEVVVMGGGNRSSKILLDPKQLTKIQNLQVVDGLANKID